ncbi:o-succinylbenzoate synthase [Leptolyngbya sp. FACHB-321]|nr:o-succinylbenzoate synthase [Leptolyngbya sp. FACHB-321]
MNSAITVQNSALRDQSSDVAVQSSTLRDQSSEVAVQSSALRPQSSEVAVQSSIVAVQNSDSTDQNSVLRPQNSNVAVQNLICQPQSPVITAHIPSRLPTPDSQLSPSPYSALLPAGNLALHTWQPLWDQGFRTFKWKIGVEAIATELKVLDALTQALPKPAKLRLDANGGLSADETTQWLQACDAMIDPSNRGVVLEYIEQPLPIAQFQSMQDLTQHYRTPIALDESVATLQQLQTCYEHGWRGIFVIKPAIVGSPSRLRQFCQHHSIDAVFSSALETAIGRRAGLRLAASLGNPDRAVGYGTTHWFKDSESDAFEQLWQTL